MVAAVSRSTALFAVLAALIIVGCSAGSRTDGPSVVTVAFGTGGNECSLTGEASTFAVGAPIHTVASFAPPLPTGTTVTVTLVRDGAELPGAQETTMTEPTPCMYMGLQHLDVGRYQVRYEIEPSSMPPATGEFEVTS